MSRLTIEKAPDRPRSEALDGQKTEPLGAVARLNGTEAGALAPESDATFLGVCRGSLHGDREFILHDASLSFGG